MAYSLFGAKPKSEHLFGFLLIRPMGTDYRKILLKIEQVSYNKMHLKMTTILSGGNLLRNVWLGAFHTL